MRSPRPVLALVLVLSAAGCLEPVGPGGAEVNYTSLYLREGIRARVAMREAGTLTAIVDSDGTWQERAVTERGWDGRFAVAEVPEGRWYLRLGDPALAPLEFFDVEGRALGLETFRIGHPREQIPRGAALGVWDENAAPQSSRTDLCLTSVAAGMLGVCSGWAQEPGRWNLAAILDFDTDVLPYHPNADLIRAGDDVRVHQFDFTLVDDGTLYGTWAAARAMQTSSFDMSSVEAPDVPVILGALNVLPLDGRIPLRIDRAGNEAVAELLHPSAEVGGHQPSVVWTLRVPGGPLVVDSATDLLASAAFEPGTTDATIDLTYGEPAGASGEKLVRQLTYFTKPYQLPGTSVAYFRGLGVSALYPANEVPDRLTVELSPPTAVTVDDQSFFADGELQPASRLAWQAPAIGTAESYQLLVYQLYAEGARTRSRLLARIHTRETSLRLPPLLSPGDHVYFVLQAMTGDADEPGAVITHSAQKVPGAEAGTTSGMFRVAGP